LDIIFVINCNSTIGGCFVINLPTETTFNVGNTSRTACDSLGHCSTSFGGGAKWCVDHINGYVYTKALQATGTMFFEVDDKTPQKPGVNAPSCRFVVGQDGSTYHATVFQTDRMLCSMAIHKTIANVTYASLDARVPK